MRAEFLKPVCVRTCWKRRSKAASFSMCCRYSAWHIQCKDSVVSNGKARSCRGSTNIKAFIGLPSAFKLPSWHAPCIKSA